MKLKKQYVLLCVFSLLLSNSVLADGLEYIHLDLNPSESAEAPDQGISEEDLRVCGAVLFQSLKHFVDRSFVDLFPVGASIWGIHSAYQAGDSLNELLNNLTNTTCTDSGCIEAKNAIQENLGNYSQMKLVTLSNGLATVGAAARFVCTLRRPAESAYLTNSLTLVFNLVAVFTAGIEYFPIWQNWSEYFSALPPSAQSSFSQLFYNSITATTLSLIGVGIAVGHYYYYRSLSALNR